MAILIRLALESDEDAIVEMGRMNVEETRPDLAFSENRLRQTFRNYLRHADPTFYVAERDRQVIGMLMADFAEYRGADGLFTMQEVLYVRPDHRGTRAAALLMKQLIAWSKMLGAREIIGGNDNEFQSERTARFLEHFGFKRVGFYMRRAIPHGEEHR